MKGLFGRTKNWNERMGVEVPDNFKIPDSDKLELMKSLMDEEVDEMYNALTENSVLDALADQLFVLYGNAARYGITYDQLKDYMAKVVQSNESKFANNEQEALESIPKEAERLNISQNDISFMEVNGKYAIFNVHTGKILKSVNYLEPHQI